MPSHQEDTGDDQQHHRSSVIRPPNSAGAVSSTTIPSVSVTPPLPSTPVRPTHLGLIGRANSDTVITMGETTQPGNDEYHHHHNHQLQQQQQQQQHQYPHRSSRLRNQTVVNATAHIDHPMDMTATTAANTTTPSPPSGEHTAVAMNKSNEVASGLMDGRGHGDEALTMVNAFSSRSPYSQMHGSVLGNLLELQRLRHRHVRNHRARTDRHQGGVNATTLNALLLQAVSSAPTSRRTSIDDMHGMMMGQQQQPLAPPPSFGSSAVPQPWKYQEPAAYSMPPRSQSPISALGGGMAMGQQSAGMGPDFVPLPDQLQIAGEIAQILLKQDYLMMLCEAMLRFGAPSHRLDHQMDRAASKLGLDAAFFTQPGVVLIRFGDPVTRTSETHILRCSNGYNLAKLADSVHVSRALDQGKISLDEAVDKLDDLLHMPDRWPWWAELSAYFISSFAGVPLAFGGDWIDAAVSGVLGLIVGVMTLMARRLRAYSDLFEVSASVVVSFIAAALHKYVCFWSVALSAVIIILPGLMLTTSVMELASRNITSGAIRLFYALTIAILIGYGVLLGVELWRIFEEFNVPSSATCNPVSPWWFFLLMPALAVSFNIHLQAAPRQWPIMTLTLVCGFTTFYFISLHVRSLIAAPAIASFVIGMVGNIYAACTGEPAAVPVLPAILLLVPGSLGVRGTLAFLQQSQGDGLLFAINMIMTSLGITVGLFAAALVSLSLLPATRRRRTDLMAL
ncbi:hypothetical protein BDF22DRAFT_734237 [Syncephalis plumigaleata]|nr:hypothetical protein BDF22DRAFT_734237 [Syncephalis plumigaleata]